MPFHPNGLDHETLKKLAKNLKKGFPKVFPDVAIATHQSQALMAIAFGYETWHEAIKVRDPSLLATADSTMPPESPLTLDDAIEVLRQASPDGALVITRWDHAVNTQVFAALRAIGHEDDVLVLNPHPQTSMLASCNVKVRMAVEDPDETFALFKNAMSEPLAASSSTVPSETPSATTPPSPRDVQLWSDLPSTVLVFEGFLAYAQGLMPLSDAVSALAADLREMERPDLAAYLTAHWAPAFADGRPDRWASTMAQVLRTTSPRAAHAVLRVARLSHRTGDFANALRPVVTALQDSVREVSAVDTVPVLRGGKGPAEPRPERRIPPIPPEAPTAPLDTALAMIVDDTVDAVVQGGGTLSALPPAIARFAGHLQPRSDTEVLQAVDALRRRLAEQAPGLCVPWPNASESKQISTEVKKTIVQLLRDNTPDMPDSRRYAMIQGLIHPSARSIAWSSTLPS